MGHPDFRVGGKIFATLHAPAKGTGAVMLMPEQQALAMDGGAGGVQPRGGRLGARRIDDRDAECGQRRLAGAEPRLGLGETGAGPLNVIPAFSFRLKFILSACLAGSRRAGVTKSALAQAGDRRCRPSPCRRRRRACRGSGIRRRRRRRWRRGRGPRRSRRARRRRSCPRPCGCGARPERRRRLSALADDALGFGAGALEHRRSLGAGLRGLRLIFGLQRLGVGAQLCGLVELLADARDLLVERGADQRPAPSSRSACAITTIIASAIQAGAVEPEGGRLRVMRVRRRAASVEALVASALAGGGGGGMLSHWPSPPSPPASPRPRRPRRRPAAATMSLRRLGRDVLDLGERRIGRGADPRLGRCDPGRDSRHWRRASAPRSPWRWPPWPRPPPSAPRRGSRRSGRDRRPRSRPAWSRARSAAARSSAILGVAPSTSPGSSGSIRRPIPKKMQAEDDRSQKNCDQKIVRKLIELRHGSSRPARARPKSAQAAHSDYMTKSMSSATANAIRPSSSAARSR